MWIGIGKDEERICKGKQVSGLNVSIIIIIIIIIHFCFVFGYSNFQLVISYLIIYLLRVSRVLEKLTGSQLVKKFPTF